MSLVFANQNDEDAIYYLTTREITGAKKHNLEPNMINDKYGCNTELVVNTKVLCKDGKMVIPTSLQHHTVV